MKKMLCTILCLSMVLVLPLALPADSDTEDTIHYEKGSIDPEDVFMLRSTQVEMDDTPAEDDTVHYGINQFKAEDFIPLTPVKVDAISDDGRIIARAAYSQLEFPGAVPNSVYSDFGIHVISDGSSATLSIQSCAWVPTYYNLEIGIYNWTTAENWYVTKSGGIINNFSKKFTNLTAGEYSVYVRNLGSSNLTTGVMWYNLT